MKARWSLVAVGSAALLIGTIMGPTVAEAGADGLVHAGGGSNQVAKVSSKGPLSVTAHRVLRQIQESVATASRPRQSVVVRSDSPTCAPGGFYRVPKKKALIITGVVFTPVSPGNPIERDVLMGPADTPCKTFVASVVT